MAAQLVPDAWILTDLLATVRGRPEIKINLQNGRFVSSFHLFPARFGWWRSADNLAQVPGEQNLEKLMR